MRSNDPPDDARPAAIDQPADAPADPATPAVPPDAEPDMDAIREEINARERKANADRFRSMGWCDQHGTLVASMP